MESGANWSEMKLVEHQDHYHTKVSKVSGSDV